MNLTEASSTRRQPLGPTNLVVFLVLSLCVGSVLAQSVVPTAERGVLDLRAWDPSTDAPVTLAGEWRFAWQELLDPTCSSYGNDSFLDLPASWTGTMHEGSPLPAVGYATFCLEVLLQEGVSPLVLWLPRVRTAGRFWINGELVAELGTVGTTEDTSYPRRIDQIITVTPAQRLMVVAQISNFHFRKGGPDKPLRLAGSLADLDPLSAARESVSAAFFVGAFLILGLYHLLTYSLKRASWAPVLFGLLCIVTAGYQLTRANNWIDSLFSISWQTEIRWEYTLFAAIVPLGAGFLRSVLPHDVPRLLPRSAAVLAAVFIASVWLLSTKTASETSLLFFQLCFLALGVWGMWCIAVAIKRGRPGALWFLICAGIWIGTGVIDGVVARFDPAAPRLLPFGFMGIIVMQAILLAIAQARSAARTKELSSRLLTLASDKLALEQAAYLDPLTGLENRRRLEDSAEDIRDHLVQDGDDHEVQETSLLYIDVDKFKNINDRYGHEAGDEALVLVARAIQEQVRPYDLSVRLGGDEFAVLTPGLGAQGAQAVAQRIQRRLNQPLEAKAAPLQLSVSIGIATVSNERFDLSTLLRHADRDMYRNKRRRARAAAVA